MVKMSIYLIITSLLLAITSHHVEAQYNYFQMALQWPPAFCRSDPANCNQHAVVNRFTIHGLWPSILNGPYLNYCNNNSRLTQAQLSAALTASLNTHWPTIRNGWNNFGLWSHEWKKHGTCSLQTFNQTQYFQTAINIITNPNYNIYQILNNVNPSLAPTVAGTGTATPAQIQNAILNSPRIGRLPGVRCSPIAGTLNWIITEVVLCFQADGRTLRDCPAAVTNCRNAHYPWRSALVKVSSFGAFFHSFVGAETDGRLLRRACGVLALVAVMVVVYLVRGRLLKILKCWRSVEIDPKKDD